MSKELEKTVELLIITDMQLAAANKKLAEAERALVVAIAAVIAGYGWCGQQDYEEAKRSESEFCAHYESVGATDTDLYREVCK